jgi:hypothetical protein
MADDDDDIFIVKLKVPHSLDKIMNFMKIMNLSGNMYVVRYFEAVHNARQRVDLETLIADAQEPRPDFLEARDYDTKHYIRA